ncbi:MAG TPA: formate dehydrogenase subunit delta [Tahibacter sp.]|uniref:formate dehydrogenase subunit delta n=1 Tax=Tahibacter sp. TaxID=2056211 RepID=UPI002CF49CDC|nr:formate dehydrogenase subunit delta [Tahibacter sp.]HSX62034.1 formate dehydrogenase subunit delta [Tahibacter sp.]
MANDIARYFAAEPEREDAIAGIATHLKRFWEPRMRAAIIAHCNDAAGTGLDDLARAAVERLARG